MTAHHLPRRSFTLALLAFVALGFLATACTRIAKPQGWASPVLAPSDDPAADDLLLAAHRDQLFALEADTLDVRWIFPLAGDDDKDIDVSALYGTPAVTNDTVFVPTYDQNGEGTLYALERDTGNLRWDFETDGPLIGDVTVAGGTVYFGSSDGNIYAVDAASGESRWNSPFETGDAVWSAPTLVGGTLYATSLDGRLYALDAETGSERWSFETDAGIVSPAVVDETASLVYVGGLDSQLRAIDLETHEARWSFKAGNWFWNKPLVANGVLYSGSLDDKVYAVDVQTGDSRWPQPFETTSPVRSAPVMVGDVLIVFDRDGTVYAIDPEDGSSAVDPPGRVGADVLVDPLVRVSADAANSENAEELVVTTTDGALVRIDPGTLKVLGRRELTGD